REKHIAVFLITFAATFSPLSSFIFFPAINALSASLNVSVEKINLTVTSYMIVAGLAPAIVGGVGSCIGAYCSGKIMNRDYRLTACAHNLVIDTNHGDDLTGFPVEKARFRSILYSICATWISTAGYGWSIQSRTVSNLPNFVKKISTVIDAHGPINHIAYSCSLVLQFIIGFAIAITFNANLNPKSPAAAQAANNIVRCSLAGAGLAFLQSCLDSMGPGWTFTLFGGLCLACLGLAWLEWKYGKRWRRQ
ncbi:hypothetical protein N7453_009056, partial [Penicillium expansum]